MLDSSLLRINLGRNVTPTPGYPERRWRRRHGGLSSGMAPRRDAIVRVAEPMRAR